MKKIIIILGLFLLILIGISTYKFVSADFKNDCMHEYIKSGKQYGYLYKLDGWRKQHIDISKNIPAQQFGYSNNCRMIVMDWKDSYFAITNSIYCGVVSIGLTIQKG